MGARTRSQMVEDTRARLIRAARSAFADKGYAGASMDDMTADVGLTRGALYHNFGDKKGLLQAVVDQIDTEMAERARAAARRARNGWEALMIESVAYIELALEPEVQRIVLLDGPAVLGDPSRWPTQNACLQTTIQAVEALIADGTIRPVDPEAAARLLSGAAFNAALWIAASDKPREVLTKVVDAFQTLAAGLLTTPHPPTWRPPRPMRRSRRPTAG